MFNEVNAMQEKMWAMEENMGNDDFDQDAYDKLRS